MVYIIRVDDLSLSRLILHGSRSRVTVQHPPSPLLPTRLSRVPPFLPSGKNIRKGLDEFRRRESSALSLPPPLPPRRSIRPVRTQCKRYDGGETPLSFQRGKNTRCRGEPFTIREGRGERTINAKRCCCRKLLIRPRPLYAV